MRARIVPLLVLAALVACAVGIGCGDSGEEAASSRGEDVATELAEGPPGPSLVAPEEGPPDELVTRDLREGEGRAAKAGDEVVVNYKGIHWDGTSYANSWTYRRPPEFELGTGRLEQGFDLGIRGMKEGGRRELRIPARLSYRPGFRPSGRLDPDASLLFIVELLELR